ncbi:hypothetical protein EJF18_40036 [Clavispora lusitaniae]|uniref:Uncharacterized protein n=1 Tax=Clavispora lusitaniae TaxID=36911 RepID=A0ACD0WL09_CLALS|nr:hypothetical protein EJF14_40036 [Clavispora lusitaniae]QFZ33678.1 hypothetical protein EJF16_40036 [Clavispora lusitaniae]QFZ39349.1 hypothetical protein EJF15_40036 [Clavispora lusitaniae]QFZ45031.1 hypothetical protein EJF18_40036 [Clavispora lusitaniae]QFZ50708.1 hypothetical protein EJF17_40036 [Clavispora lusitaniae]
MDDCVMERDMRTDSDAHLYLFNLHRCNLFLFRLFASFPCIISFATSIFRRLAFLLTRLNSVALTIVHRMEYLSAPLLLQIYHESLVKETHCLEARLLNLCWVIQTYENVLARARFFLKSQQPQNDLEPQHYVHQLKNMYLKMKHQNDFLSGRLASAKQKKAKSSSLTEAEVKATIIQYNCLYDELKKIEELSHAVKEARKAAEEARRIRRERSRKASRVVSCNPENPNVCRQIN